MVIEAARLAAGDLARPEFRRSFLFSLALTLVALAGTWIAAREIFDALAWPWIGDHLPALPQWAGWLGSLAAIVAGIGLALALALLVAPATALVAGFFLDDIAALVERTHYPDDPPGRAMPAVQAALLSARFFVVVVAANVLALLLLLVPGVNLVAFFAVNAWLLGREYFEFAAMRFHTPAEARALRSMNAGTVFLGGLVVAAFLAVPLLNLLTPFFGASLMVHLHKAVAARGGDGLMPARPASYRPPSPRS